jgi:hypothetical protein
MAACNAIVMGLVHDRVIVTVAFAIPTGHVTIQMTAKFTAVTDHPRHCCCPQTVGSCKDYKWPQVSGIGVQRCIVDLEAFTLESS